MEHEVGEIVEIIHDNKTIKLEVVEQDFCSFCFFHNRYNFGTTAPCMRHEYHLEDYYCSKIFRNDRKSVIYKQIK